MWLHTAKTFLSWLLLLSGLFLMGCGASRWSPTDPRVDSDEQCQVNVKQHVEIGIEGNVTP